MRLLLIDDSAAYHEEFADLLARSDLTFSALDRASTAEEGARLLLAGLHDAYVVDFRLPGDTGLTLIEQARTAGMSKPIIMLTGFDNPDLDLAAQKVGANDYLSKGHFSPETLARSIRYAASNAAAIRRATEAESRFRLAQEAAGIGTWEWDLQANTFDWSDIQCALFGLDADRGGTIRFETWRAIIHPDDRDTVQAAMISALAGRSTLDVTFRIRRPDPANRTAPTALRWISAQGRVQAGGDGSPLRLLGVSVDVTDRQNAEMDLRAGRDRAVTGMRLSEARFRTYFESAVDCQFHVALGPDGQFRYENVNPAGLAHTSLPVSAMIDRTPEDVLGAAVGGVMTERLRRVVETGEAVSFEAALDMGTGSVIYDAIYMPLFDEIGTVVGVLGSARDITERRRLEQVAQQAQKMEALGHLAGGVAHDFNNLLQNMMSCFDLLRKQVSSEKGKTLLQEGRDTVKRGTSLTGRLLSFSRQQVLTTQVIDVNAVIGELTDVLARTLDGGVRVGHRLSEELWPVSADRNQVEIALLNLGINARDAMPLGGALTIETQNETVVGTQPDGLAPGDYVTVSVADTGTGMGPDVLARALEPFFTTKELGKGTGLGLSMVYGTVKQFGGGVRIESQVSEGTRVTLYLPRASAKAETKVRPVSERFEPCAPATILLVDDDASTQAAVQAYADDLGHTVIVAISGTEALQLLDAGQTVDAMVVDETLPGMTGPVLIDLAQQRRPDLPAVLISGQPNTGESASDAFVLAKPFRQEQFDAALSAMLQGQRSSAVVVPIRGKIR